MTLTIEQKEKLKEIMDELIPEFGVIKDQDSKEKISESLTGKKDSHDKIITGTDEEKIEIIDFYNNFKHVDLENKKQKLLEKVNELNNRINEIDIELSEYDEEDEEEDKDKVEIIGEE